MNQKEEIDEVPTIKEPTVKEPTVKEPTVEEITRNLWDHLSKKVPTLTGVSLIESSEFDRCRKVSLTKN